MSKHYIAMAGLYGYMPNFCASLDTYASAVDTLADLHELSKRRKRELKRDGVLELNLSRDGNEYCEIEECNCENSDEHND